MDNYIYEGTNYTNRSVSTLRGEKNTLMFYVLGTAAPALTVEETLYKYT